MPGPVEPPAPPPRRPPPVAWGAAVFPVVLWFLATFFFLGDTGKWNDDWFYTQRVPETGAVRALSLDRPVHFWRPLYRVILPALETLLWRHDPVSHLIGAAAHGAAALLLWRLLLCLGSRRQPAAIAALFFLVTPAAFEVPLWTCAMPTGLATAAALGALLAAARTPRSARGRLAQALLVLLLTAVAVSLNEQPAGLALAAPLVVFARPRAQRPERMVGRAAALAAAAAVPLTAYILVHARLHPLANAVGRREVLLPFGAIPGSIARALHWTRHSFLSADFLRSSLWHAMGALAQKPTLAIAACGLAAISACPWMGHFLRHGHETLPGAERPPVPPARLLLLGAALFALAWAPIVAVEYPLSPRITYAPAVGIAVALAGILSLLALRPIPHPRTAARAAAVALALALAAAILTSLALAMVGVQDAYRRRAALDRENLLSLHTQIPSPPPGAVFAPAHMEPPAAPAFRRAFEAHFLSAMGSWWSAAHIVRLEYRRSDLFAGDAPWGRHALLAPDAQSVRVPNVGRVPWGRVVPFEIDSAGRLSLITTLCFERQGSTPLEITLPITSAAADQGRFPRRTLTIAAPPPARP